jgi:hypothetical protein
MDTTEDSWENQHTPGYTKSKWYYGPYLKNEENGVTPWESETYVL